MGQADLEDNSKAGKLRDIFERLCSTTRVTSNEIDSISRQAKIAMRRTIRTKVAKFPIETL